MSGHMKRLAAAALMVSALGSVAQAECTLGKRVDIPGGKHAYRLSDGSTVFLGRLAVDADGSPRAYNPKSDLGLDKLAYAGHPGKWWGIATDTCESNGKPVVQGPNDPAPGFYVSTTTMTDPSIKGCANPAQYVNAEVIPYVALPHAISTFDKEQHQGNLVAALAPSGKTSLAVFADVAPPDGIGEGSMRFAGNLGYSSNPRNGGTETREIVYLVLAARMGFPKDAKAVSDAADPAFSAWGGLPRLKECRAALEKAPK